MIHVIGEFLEGGWREGARKEEGRRSERKEG
jgi:hypothetical protein